MKAYGPYDLSHLLWSRKHHPPSTKGVPQLRGSHPTPLFLKVIETLNKVGVPLAFQFGMGCNPPAQKGDYVVVDTRLWEGI